jgi:hypothetical protein
VRRTCSEIEVDNVELMRKITEVEQEVLKLNADMKKLQNNHWKEIRKRDRNKMATSSLVALCVLVNVLV